MLIEKGMITLFARYMKKQQALLKGLSSVTSAQTATPERIHTGCGVRLEVKKVGLCGEEIPRLTHSRPPFLADSAYHLLPCLNETGLEQSVGSDEAHASSTKLHIPNKDKICRTSSRCSAR